MVSIIMPTYNRASTIKEAIDSVLNQTYSNLELIVVDDGSTDNTEELVHKINDSRLLYIKQMKNQGACVARNLGIQIAKGEYIAFQDSDSVWHNDKLIKQLNIIKLTNADVVCCSQYNSEYEIIPSYKEGFINRNVYGIGTPTILGKMEVFKEIQFNERMPRLQDFELLFRVQEKYTIYYQEEALIDVYYNNNGLSDSPTKLLWACELLLEIYPNLVKLYPQTAYYLANFLLGDAKSLNQCDKVVRMKMCRLALKYSLKLKVLVKFLLLSMKITWEVNPEGYVMLKKLK